MRFTRRLLPILLLCLVVVRVGAQEVGQDGTDLIELSLGYGFGAPFDSGFWLDTGSGGISREVITEDLIKRVFIQRELAERIFLDLDYDSDRQGGFFDGDNVYSLEYQGLENEFLQEISAGNRHLSIPETRLIPIDQGNASSYALQARMGTDRFRIQGLARYSQALSGTKRFRGAAQLIETEALDVSYLKRRFFFLPDSGIDENTLELLRSSEVPADRTIDGSYFELLVRGEDYRFDNITGRISLNRTLDEEDEELLVYYEKGGLAVGNVLLGINGIIDETGTRDDFSQSAYPQYFGTDGATDYLYLRKLSFNSYWEIKGAYALSEVYAGVFPQDIRVDLLRTESGERNENYGSLLGSYSVESNFGALIFTFEDAVGFYPRPFPGLFPFTHPTDPVNPFDPENPIYGGTEEPVAEVSVNTLVLRYAVDRDNYFLDFDIIEGSVRVTVDGQPLGSQYYTVDTFSGIIFFGEGVIGPTSDIEVTYKYAPLLGGNQELFLALGLDYELDWLSLRNLTTFTYPLTAPPAPFVGEERSTVLANSTDLSISLGKNLANGELAVQLDAGAAFAVTNSNHKRAAVVADMEQDRRVNIDLSEDSWILGSLSQPLPAEGISLSNRGDLLYENYWDGDVLSELSWDNSGNPSFTYAEKAGPYNSADRASGGEDLSLVLDFSIPSGLADAFVSTAGMFQSLNLLDFSRLHVILRGEQITGDDVQVYIEFLRVYQEDLDGDDALDAEVTRDQAGFAITPLPAGSGSTVLGTDRLGGGNDHIDSEDVNDNGVLDPIGPYAADQETGSVIVSPNAVAELVTISPGDENWKTVTVNIQQLIADNSSVFEAVQAVRITVKAATSPTPTTVSGRVLINGLWLSGSGITNESPEYLTLLEVSTNEDPLVEGNAFSDKYPEIYDELHGRPGYRTEQGHLEKVLQCSFDPAGSAGGQLLEGESATLSRRFGYLTDFSAYREFRSYLYLPAGETIPAGAVLTLEFAGSILDRLTFDIAASDIQIGWNEIVVALEGSYTLTVNGSSTGMPLASGAVEVLRRISEVRFGVKATAASGDITGSFEFWLDEWHLAESRYSFDAAAYVETTVDYTGDLLKIGSTPILSNLGFRGGVEHREGHFLETFGEQQNSWFTGVDARLVRFFPTSVDLSGYGRTSDGLFGEPGESFPGGVEERDRSWSYGHLIGLDSGFEYLPVLEHRYSRSVGEVGEVGLSASGYLFDQEKTTRESLGLSEVYRYPEGFEQRYSYDRSWLYTDQETLLLDSPPVLQGSGRDLSVGQRHTGSLSYSWQRNLTSLNLSRDDLWNLADPLIPQTLFGSYLERMGRLFRSVPSLYPGAVLERRQDDGAFRLSLPRAKFVGMALDMDSAFEDRQTSPGTGSRDVSVENVLRISAPFSPRGKGILEFTPSVTRSCSGDFGLDSGPALPKEEFLLLGQAWRILLMPPLYYLNPRLERGRLNEYDAVDLLAESSAMSGLEEVGIDTSLSLDFRIAEPPRYLPSRGNLEFAGQTGREGESYTQSRSISFGLGRDFRLGSDPKIQGNRLSVDAGWEGGWDYAHKVVSHTLFLDTGLDLREGMRGQLSVDHNLSIASKRQRLGDEALLLFPGQPGKEVAVPFQLNTNTVSSVIGLEYSRDREIDPRRRELLAASRMISDGSEGDIGRTSHRDKFELENNFLDVLNGEQTELGNTTVVPLRLLYTHDTVMTVSEYLDLELSVKTIGGVEEIITTDPEEINYKPALGFELRLSAILNF